MIVTFRELLADARQRGRAVGAFTCYNLETAAGVLEAARSRGADVILLIAERAFRERGGGALLAALRGVAQASDVRTCIQLDHVEDIDLIERAFAAGVGAVMADGSKLSLPENIDFLRAVQAAAKPHDGGVEAELGGIAGDEDVATAVAAGALTDPTEAAQLVGETGIDCLAVSIGNVHGAYREPPALDWERLDAVRDAAAVGLSLHGASGLPDSDVARAVRAGILKVNVNTELRLAYLEASERAWPGIRDGARLLELNRRQREAIGEVVEAKLPILAAAE